MEVQVGFYKILRSGEPISNSLTKGAPAILAATFVAGLLGYLLTALVFREVGSVQYVWFAAYWSTLHLVIGSLSGVEQEFARATKKTNTSNSKTKSPSRVFAIGFAVIVMFIAITTSGIWAVPVLGDQGPLLVFPFAVGTAAFVFVATIGGTLYGLSRWNLLALMIAVDGIIRVSLLLIALLITDDLVVLAWCVSIAFPLTVVVLWPLLQKAISGQTEVDVSLGTLTWNVSRTVTASASSALLVTGFPILIVLASPGIDLVFIGQLILCLTLLRAPLIVVAMSMQSFLVVKFRDQTSSSMKFMTAINLGIVIVTAVITWLAASFGTAVLQILSDEKPLITGEILANISISAGLFAMMIVLATPILARGYHFVYSLGWLFSALTTVFLMLGSGEFVDRVISAMILGPTVGLVTFLITMLLTRKKTTAPEL